MNEKKKIEEEIWIRKNNLSKEKWLKNEFYAIIYDNRFWLIN